LRGHASVCVHGLRAQVRVRARVSRLPPLRVGEGSQQLPDERAQLVGAIASLECSRRL
jgi:hypothetical protein